MEKDFYSDTVGLKPIWVGEKLNKKEAIDSKLWEILCKKKKYYFFKELKYKLNRTKYKYYLYSKYFDKVVDVKTDQVSKKNRKIKEKFFFFKRCKND